MSRPIHAAVPHQLGKEEAKRRLSSRIGELPNHIPGGAARVGSAWTGDDRMTLNVYAMGQEVQATIDVGETALDVMINLPPMLGFFSDAIRKTIEKKGGTLLLDNKSDKD